MGAYAEGKLYYDETWKTLSLNAGRDVNLQIGQEDLRRCYNNTGVTIYNGQAVYVTGVYAGTNACPTIALAKSDLPDTAFLLGCATQDIPDANYGFVTVRGNVNDLDSIRIGSAYLSTQGMAMDCLVGGTTGNSYTFTVVDTTTGGLKYTEVGGAVIVDLGGTTPTRAQVATLINTTTPSAYIRIVVETAGNVIVASVLPFAGGVATTEGDVLYLSPYIPGKLRIGVPDAPNLEIRVGRLITKSATVGRVNVRIYQGYRFNDLSDVTCPSPAVDETIKWNGNAWVNAAAGSVSAGPSIAFYNSSPVFNSKVSPSGLSQDGTAGNGIRINSLSKTPVTSVSHTVTISHASPAVVTCAAHGLPISAPIVFSTTTTLPAPLVAGTTYYILSAGYATGSFRIATSVEGTAINTTSDGSGTHTCTATELTAQGQADTDTRAFVAWLYNTAIGRTSIDAGVWDFTTYVGVDSIGGGRVTTLTRNIYQVVPPASGTVTTSGAGANSRTATITSSQFSGTYFAGSATNTTASYLQTPSGIFQITGVTSVNVVTITVPTGYANESTVTFNIWNKLFGATSTAITNITPSYGVVTSQLAQPAFTVATTDKLGQMGFITSNHATTLTVAYNGTAHNTNFTTPLIVLHNNLAGLNAVGGNYQHLTDAQLTVATQAASGSVNGYLASGDFTTFSGKANASLGNLASVAINTTLLPASNDGAGLGNGTYSFADLFLASGGIINWANSNVTVTHATGSLTVAATTFALGATNLTMTGSIADTTNRVLKGWFTDLQCTNAMAGSITGNAATVTVAAEATDQTCYPLFVTGANGDLAPKTHASFGFDALNGWLGVGTATPSSKLHVTTAYTNAYGTAVQLFTNTTLTTNGSLYNIGQLIDCSVNNITAGVTDSGYKACLQINNTPSGVGFAGTQTASIGLLSYSGIGVLATAGAIITNAYGVQIANYNLTAGTTVTNSYGVYINSRYSATGTITNAWDVYAASSTSKNYFAGNVGIGVTDPTSHLHVVAANPQVVIASASSWSQLYCNGDAVSVRFAALPAYSLGLLGTESNHNFGIYTNNAQRMLFIASGNALIGTGDDDGTPATGRLVVQGSTNDGTTNVFVGRDSDGANVAWLDTNGVLQAIGGLVAGLDAATNTAGTLKMFAAGANAYYNTFTSGENTANATYTLPVAMPAYSGYVLACTDAGVMSWASNGANLALSNLASVAINTTLLPGSNDGAGLGNGTYGFADLFLAAGGVLNWNNGNATITHATGSLTVAATTFALGSTNITMSGSIGVTGTRVLKGWFTDLECTNAIAASITGNAATFTCADESTDTSCFPVFVTTATGSQGAKTVSSLTFNSNTGALGSSLFTANTITANTGFVPDANDGAYLGTTSLQFSDLFLAEGGVINWDNGDATLTQVGNIVTLAGAGLVVSESTGLELGLDAATNTAGFLKMWSAGAVNFSTTFTAGTQSADATYTLPTAMPASNMVLQSTSAGVMSWTSNVAGSALTVTQAAQSSITSLGTLTTLTVDNITLDASSITGITAANTTITAYAGNAIAVESVLFDNGVVGWPSEIAHGNSGSTHTINFNEGQHQTITLNANCTLTLTAPALGPGTFYLTATEDGTGGWDFTYPGATTFPGKAKPAITTTANAINLLMFYWNGSVWRCGLAMANIGTV